MESLTFPLDARAWFQRWEAMQTCYVPQRVYRFDLMLYLAGLDPSAAVHILDLGCGAGSLTWRALHIYPQAHVVAVDADPVLLAMARALRPDAADRVTFLQADLRHAAWWAPYEGAFDLVVSATALHWLDAAHLEQVFRRIYRALRPGGVFMNSDHMASDEPCWQEVYRRLLERQQAAAFRATGADRWDGFWQALAAAWAARAGEMPRSADDVWEGSDDGETESSHRAALAAAGFDRITLHWRNLGDAVLSAEKSAR